MAMYVISHEQAWMAAAAKYNFAVEKPTKWPVLVAFELTETIDTEGNTSMQVTSDVAVIGVGAAAKLIANAQPNAMLQQVDAITLGKIKGVMEGVQKKKLIKVPVETFNPGQMVQVTADNPAGPSITFKIPTGLYKVGDIVKISGMNYTISDMTTEVAEINPLTGEASLVEVKEEPEVAPKQIAGMDEIPLDPSKLEKPTKISDEVDDMEHVLDTERAV